MYIKEEFDRIIDRIVLARDQACNPEFKSMWDYKLRVLLKETLGSKDQNTYRNIITTECYNSQG